MKFNISTQLKKTRTDIGECNKAIEEIKANVLRAQIAIDEHDGVRTALDEAKRRKEQILGEAFIAGKVADTAAVDAEIKELTAKNPDGARHALKLLTDKLAEAEARLNGLKSHEAELVSELTRDLLANEVADAEKCRDAFIEAGQRVQAIRDFAIRNKLACSGTRDFYDAQAIHRLAHSSARDQPAQARFEKSAADLADQLQAQAWGEA